MLQDLRSYIKLFSEYTELRAQESRGLSVVMVKGNLMGNDRWSRSGISARVYKNGVWGFASNRTITQETIHHVIEAAAENALFLDSREKRQQKNLPPSHAISLNDFSTSKPQKTQKELIDFVKNIDDYIAIKYKNLVSRNVIISSLDMEKSLVTSEKSSSYSMIPRAMVAFSLTVEKDGEPFNLGGYEGGLGQFEDLFTTPDKLYQRIDETYEHLMKKSEGIYAEAGYHDCVMDSDLAGILAHESIGHTTEADLVLGGSIAADYLNERVASDIFSLVDFANTYNGETLPVPVYIDDEGTKAEDVTIIKDGILKNYMHNKETARELGVNPTGNARAWLFSDEPLVRMRNTAILPGESKLDDMIASIDDGYYLIKPSNGQADSTSEFMFGVTLGYEVKKGKLGKAIRNTTISGVAFDMLKTITMISDDMSWSNAGMCGKKQPIPVGMGGPAIKCKINIGGK